MGSSSLWLSGPFTAADFLSKNDTPSPTVFSNLSQSAVVLNDIYNTVAPFALVSSYRSPAAQSKLIESGNVQAVAHSHHSDGLAFDITPTTMGAADFLERLLSGPFKNRLGQVAVKDYSLHIQMPTTGFPELTPMFVAANGLYYRFDQNSLANYLATGVRPDQIASYALPDPLSYSEGAETSLLSRILIPAIIAGAIAGLFLLTKKRLKETSA